MMSTEAVEVIRQANRELTNFFAQRNSAASETLDLQAVSEAISRVGQSLVQFPLPPQLDAPSQTEVSHYAENLQQLKTTLENLQPELVARHDTLAAHLKKTQAALAWVNSYNQTY
jgi:hypothetical protein